MSIALTIVKDWRPIVDYLDIKNYAEILVLKPVRLTGLA